LQFRTASGKTVGYRADARAEVCGWRQDSEVIHDNEKRRSRLNPESFRRLNLAGIVVAFACSGNDIVPPPPPPPPPAIDVIFPSAAVTGSPDLTLTITGSNFVDGGPNGTYAAWSMGSDTSLLATTYVSSTQLTAVIPAALLSNSVTAQVLLETGDIMGDYPLLKSNALGFVVTDNTDPSRTGTIIVHGQTSTVAPIAKGSREVSLDGGPSVRLAETQTRVTSCHPEPRVPA